MALRPGVVALQARLGHQDLQKAELPGRRRLVQHAAVTGPDHDTDAKINKYIRRQALLTGVPEFPSHPRQPY